MTIDRARPVAVRMDMSSDALRAAVRDDLVMSGVRRRLLAGERVIRSPALVAYVSDIPSPDANEVVHARFAEGDAADVAIEETIGLFGGRPLLWWVGPDDEPADLSERLARHGVMFLDEIPGMAMDLEALQDEAPSDGLRVEAPPDGLRVEPVLDAAALAAFHAVLSHGFPEDFTDEATEGTIAAGTLRVAEDTGFREPNGTPTRWLGWLGDRPVTTTRLHTAAGVAGIYAVITVGDARRRGYGEAVTRHVLRVARDAGLRIATLQASSAGRGVYERIGFRELCRYRLHEWRPTADR